MGNVRLWTNCFRWLYELAFSMHCARMVMMKWGLGVDAVVRYLIVHVVFPLAPKLGNSLQYGPRSFFAFVVVWWVLAAVILVCLRIAGCVRSLWGLVLHITGLGAVAGLPVLFLLLRDEPRGTLTDRWHPGAGPWLWLEVAVVVACVCIYLHRRGQAMGALGILVGALHFGLWGWVVWGCHVAGMLGWVWELWRQPCWNLAEYVLPPVAASLAWGLYVRLSARGNAPAGSPGA